MKQLVLSLVALVVLSGCNESFLRGLLEVGSQDIKLTDRYGQQHTLAAHSDYGLDMNYKSNIGVVELKFDRLRAGGFEFEVPEGIRIPEHGGRFSLPAGANGQDYTLEGHIDRVFSHSATRHYTQSCTYTEHERYRVCERIRPQPRDCPRYGTDQVRPGPGRPVPPCRPLPPRTECRWESRVISRNGYRQMESYDRVENINLRAYLVNPFSHQEVAQISGQRSHRETIVTYRGQCR